jgi:hypothetical protein
MSSGLVRQLHGLVGQVEAYIAVPGAYELTALYNQLRSQDRGPSGGVGRSGPGGVRLREREVDDKGAIAVHDHVAVKTGAHIVVAAAAAGAGGVEEPAGRAPMGEVLRTVGELAVPRVDDEPVGVAKPEHVGAFVTAPVLLHASGHLAEAVDVFVDGPTVEAPAEGRSRWPHRVHDLGPFHLVDVAATAAEGRGALALTMVNRSEQEERVEIVLRDAAFTGSARVRCLTASRRPSAVPGVE